MVRVKLYGTFGSLLLYFFLSSSRGMNCPVDHMEQWPTGESRTEYYDDTAAPDHKEDWRLTWMSKLDDDTRFNDVTIPGTHESSSYYGGAWVQCNTWTLTDQLKAGLRFFDVRSNSLNDEIQVWHGIIFQRNCLKNVVRDIVQFLETNPGEFVLLRLENYARLESSNTMTYSEAVTSITELYDEKYFWKQSVFPSTVAQARGKLLILHGWKGDEMWGIKYGANSVIADDFEIDSRDDLDSKWRGNVQHLNNAVNADLDTMYIMYNSGTGLVWPPRRVANSSNFLLYNFIDTLKKPSRRGIILLDYPGYGLVGKIISLNKGML